MAFAEFMDCFGAALGKSRNLDGRQTDWNRQFWAMVRERVGNTMAEFNSPLFRQSLFLHPKG